MTLVEVLLGVTITAILMAPLSMVFIVSARGSDAAGDSLTNGGEAQRIGAAWTADVQNVDSGGVNVGRCSVSDPSSEETHLVSFTWNQSSSAIGLPRTADWVAMGTGEDLQIVRRVCDQVGGGIAEDVLAEHVGTDGQDVLDTVHGPGADPRDFCPPVNKAVAGPQVWVSESCTIVVTGGLNYSLEVSRRVPEQNSSTNPARAPDKPTITNAEPRNKYVTVFWDSLPVPAGQPAVEKYRLYIYQDPNGDPITNVVVDGASGGAGGHFAVVAGLTNDIGYYARVQALNVVGWGELSDSFGPFQPHATEPDAPTVPAVMPGDRSVLVNWTANSNDGGSDVLLWRIYVIDLNGVETGPTEITPATTTTGTVTGLVNGRSYRVKVAGVNAKGEGIRSEFSEVVVPFGAPPPAGGVIAQANDGRVDVRWAPPAFDNGRPIIGFVVRAYQGVDQTTAMNGGTYVTKDGSCWEEPDPDDPDNPAKNTTICQVTQNVANGAYYRFAVASRSDVGDGTTIDGVESTFSAPYPAPAVQPLNPPYVRPSTAPSAPSAPILSASGNTLTVAFTLPADGGEPIQRAFVEFERKSTASGSGWESWVSADSAGFSVSGSAGDRQSVSFAGEAGQSYHVRVSVANKGEWFSSQAGWRKGPVSKQSGDVTVATSPGPPPAPTVARTVGNTYPFSVNLAWNPPTNDGGACIDQYKVESSPDGSTWDLSSVFPATENCATAAVAATSSTFGGIPAGGGSGTRYFRVSAHSAAGWGPVSAAGSTTALRQQCTLTATESKWVGIKDGEPEQGTDSIKVKYSGSVDRWGFVKFDPRPTVGTMCAEFSERLPATAVPDGRPSGYATDGMPATAAVVTAEATKVPSSGKVAIHQASSEWTESGLTWDNKPARKSETDYISGGGTGWRWWWVKSSYVTQQRNDAKRFGWILGQKEGSDGWIFNSRLSSSPPKLIVRFR